ncbi:hypothetical protein P7K49_001501 [Saguinus oedipus]|uniref:Uncharacterized protein n=1 Tax=Saguinus oedipus TaxID=9490 RepID=A0ABQ9WF53_SAGOE|nr:hypothetical protein P7K49_001501 [Saguinus oedipus]
MLLYWHQVCLLRCIAGFILIEQMPGGIIFTLLELCDLDLCDYNEMAFTRIISDFRQTRKLRQPEEYYITLQKTILITDSENQTVDQYISTVDGVAKVLSRERKPRHLYDLNEQQETLLPHHTIQKSHRSDLPGFLKNIKKKHAASHKISPLRNAFNEFKYDGKLDLKRERLPIFCCEDLNEQGMGKEDCGGK